MSSHSEIAAMEIADIEQGVDHALTIARARRRVQITILASEPLQDLAIPFLDTGIPVYLNSSPQGDTFKTVADQNEVATEDKPAEAIIHAESLRTALRMALGKSEVKITVGPKKESGPSSRRHSAKTSATT